MTQNGDRKTGILTSGLRKKLKTGFSEVDHEDRERQRIRERVKNAIIDFRILNRFLDESDRNNILEGIAVSDNQTPDDFEPIEVYEQSTDEGQKLINGLNEGITFMFRCFLEKGLPLEGAIQSTLQQAYEWEEGPFTVESVDFEVNYTTNLDYDELYQKFRDDTLSEIDEVALLWILGKGTTGFQYLEDYDFHQRVEEVDIGDTIEKLDSGDKLTVAEGVALYNAYMVGNEQLTPEVMIEAVKNEIRHRNSNNGNKNE